MAHDARIRAAAGTCSAVFVGEGTLLAQCAEAFLGAGHEVHAVVVADAMLRRWAADRHIAVLDPASDIAAALRDQPFDFLFSVANLSVLPADLIALPRRYAINFQDALLPGYAGLHATSWALLHGERTHGVTWHVMTADIDAGAILKQRSFDVSDGETALSLNAKCYEAGIASFAELLAELAEGRESLALQSQKGRSYFGRYQQPAAGCMIAWDHPAREIAALACALDFGPYENPLGVPKLWLNGALLAVREIAARDAVATAPAGTVTAVTDDAIDVAAPDAPLTLREFATLDG